MKTLELTGQLLNYWVAKALDSLPGHEFRLGLTVDTGIMFRNLESGVDVVWEPSTNWGQGGPIIDRERIALVCTRPRHDTNAGERWNAIVNGDYVGSDGQVESRNPGTNNDGEGPTPLIAAMRALVASEYGDEVPEASP